MEFNKTIQIIVITIFASVFSINAQNIGINEDNSVPDPSAMLDVKSETKGILIPRIAYGNLPASPAYGLMIFLSSGSGPNTIGSAPNLSSNNFYWFNGSYWEKLSDSYWNFSNGDIRTSDDVIINSSAAIGNGANPGYQFSFYTLILADDTPRLLFEDTSMGTFPTNDWALEANGSTEGSGDYFAIVNETSSTYPFVIEAPGVDNAFYIKGSNVGLGTNNPLTQLHLISGNSPTIRLHQDNSEANPEQIWDVSGNAVGFSLIDITNSSAVPVFIETAAPTNSIYIDSLGNTGFGTAAPARKVHISDAMKLEPQATPPANPAKGDLYFDDNDNILKCYDGTQWQNCW